MILDKGVIENVTEFLLQDWVFEIQKISIRLLFKRPGAWS